MNSKVLIKQHPSGINVVLDRNISFEELAAEVASHFKEAASFFGKCQLTVTFTGRTLSAEQEDILCERIEENSQITILCVFVEDKVRDAVYVRARKIMEDQAVLRAAMSVTGRKKPRISEYLTYPGDIPAGETCRTTHNILVLGNIPEGATLVSEQNVVVLGSIRGTAMAGSRAGSRMSETLSDLACENAGSHVILAGDLHPERLVIDEISYRPAPVPEERTGGLFGRGNRPKEETKAAPGVAYVQDGRILTAALDPASMQHVLAAAGLNL